MNKKEKATTYEAMFLLEQGTAATDWNSVSADIQKILTKHKANVICLDKWGERKLTYRIRKQARGVYALAYFTAPIDAVPAIKAECVLSETIMRVLIVSHEGEIKKSEAPKDFERKEDSDELFRRDRPYSRDARPSWQT